MKPVWNKIDFDPWSRGNLQIETNYFSENPIILELEGDGYETYDLRESMTPREARELAQKLIEAADAADRAGAFTNGDRG